MECDQKGLKLLIYQFAQRIVLSNRVSRVIDTFLDNVGQFSRSNHRIVTGLLAENPASCLSNSQPLWTPDQLVLVALHVRLGLKPTFRAEHDYLANC
jgi:hypothetical protein